jgi:hypothetical protein
MSARHIDFAVFGASPQARLIAGLLASVHKKAVLFQGESQSGYRLPRGIDLSVAPLTRPESWAMLAKLTRETHKLLNRIGGRGAVSRVDPIFHASMREGIEALGHVSHMAQAFALSAERVRPNVLEEGQQGVLFRDALLLHRASLEPVLDRWLGSLGVARVEMDAPLVLKPDGSAVVVEDDQGYEIAQTVLADDGAIITHLSPEIWPGIITAQIASTVLTEAGKPLPSRLMYRLDTGVVLSGQARAGLVALGPGTIEQVGQAVAAGLGTQRIRQVGQSSYQRIVAADGAPVVGRVGGTGPDLIAGLGLSGAFFAPAIARWLAGTASEEENNWFAARLVDRDPAHSSVAEWGDPL